jgi:hypothetical protein
MNFVCRYSVLLLGLAIGRRQGLYLHKQNTRKEIHELCTDSKWDLKPVFQCSTGGRRYCLRGRGHCNEPIVRTVFCILYPLSCVQDMPLIRMHYLSKLPSCKGFIRQLEQVHFKSRPESL